MKIDVNILFVVQCISIVLIIGLSITTIVLVRLVKKLSDRVNDTNRIGYFNWKECSQLKQTTNDIIDLNEQIITTVKTIADDLEVKIKQENEEKQKKIYPTPELSKMITETIQEQIEMEIVLSRNLTAPSNEYITNITYNVMQTYPQVHPDYIHKKCLAIIESELDRYRPDNV